MSAQIIPLPTAAAKKVRQPRNAYCRAYRQGLPLFPRDSWADRRPAAHDLQMAERICDADERAAILIATQIYSVLDSGDKARVMGRVLAHAIKSPDSPTPKQALAWLAYEDATLDHKKRIVAAMGFLNRGGFA